MCYTWLSHGIKRSPYLYRFYHIVENILILCTKSYLVFSHCLFLLGVKKVGTWDMVDAQSQRIPLMQGPTLQTKEQPWIDWCLQGQTSFQQVTINLLNRYSVGSLQWL